MFDIGTYHVTFLSCDKNNDKKVFVKGGGGYRSSKISRKGGGTENFARKGGVLRKGGYNLKGGGIHLF